MFGVAQTSDSKKKKKKLWLDKLNKKTKVWIPGSG
jgi:hypothetical protein